ncbi:hypothetical protein [Leifsonia sp. RAF41]|uniref:hypothetical protein n=1 Tax=Leifsonia sp. RAF41 TaxID=3233056 RepID=UPI003F9E9672
MDERIESLGAEPPERKAARAFALWAILDALPETDPTRFDKARRAYLADPSENGEPAN